MFYLSWIKIGLNKIKDRIKLVEVKLIFFEFLSIHCHYYLLSNSIWSNKLNFNKLIINK